MSSQDFRRLAISSPSFNTLHKTLNMLEAKRVKLKSLALVKWAKISFIEGTLVSGNSNNKSQY